MLLLKIDNKFHGVFFVCFFTITLPMLIQCLVDAQIFEEDRRKDREEGGI